MNPEHMAESDHWITRPAFPDYRELFRESDIKNAVAFLIFRFPFQFVVAFSLAHVFRFVPELSGRLLVLCLTLIAQLFAPSCHRGKADIHSLAASATV